MRIDYWIDWLATVFGFMIKLCRLIILVRPVSMETPGFASPIRVFQNSLCQMRKSNDENDKEQTVLDSLGVLDLDLSLVRIGFALKAFDEEKPITRILPGSGPCDFTATSSRCGLGDTGFHDVVIETCWYFGLEIEAG